MKHILKIYIILSLSLFYTSLSGQNTINGKHIMEYQIQGKDTVFVDDIPPAMIHPKQQMSKKNWVKYYKRVHNFSKAYPYALVVSRTIRQTDSLFAADNYSKKEQSRYLNKMKDDLLNNFDPIFRNLTLKQGLMMIRLIDREVGLTPYYIIKNYLGGPTAFFWQGFAKMFSGDLKKPYDKFGEDKDLEELVGIWEQGEFDDLYFMIFGQNRPAIFIPEKYR